MKRSGLRKSALVAIMIVQPILWLCSTTSARAQDLQNGDLLVGYDTSANPFSPGPGGILRVRNGVTTPFCLGSLDPSLDLNFDTPPQVMVDSQGRVVFMTADRNRSGYGMYRCSSVGGPVEKFAFFPTFFGVTAPAGVVVPFPGRVFNSSTFAGLHLTKTPAIIIDGSVNGGKPQVTTEDVYNFTAQEATEQGGVITLGATHTYRFHVTTGAWEVAQDPGSDFLEPPDDLINHSGTTFSVFSSGPPIGAANRPQRLRRVTNPLELKVSGSAAGIINFSLDLSLFGGVQEVAALTLDDVTVPNVDSGCPPPIDEISNLMPLNGGAFGGMTGFQNIAYDEFGDLALVVTSNAGVGGGPYLTNISEALLDNPNDPSQFFHDSFVGCAAIPTLQFRSLVPFFEPTGFFNGIGDPGNPPTKALVSASGGLAGTQSFAGNVIRILPGNVQVLASGIARPSGIGAYPNGVQPPSGGVIVVQIDSPVSVLITDPSGKRIGVDLQGQVFNDFGIDGFDSGAGEPRFYAIRNPVSGSYAVQAVGTANGSFTIHVYSADLSQSEGQHIQTTGIAVPGSMSSADFTVAPGGAVAFVAPADTIPPTTTVTLSPQPNAVGWNNQNVTATLNATDSAGGSGVKQITYSATGAQTVAGVANAPSVSTLISSEGATTLTFSATDNAGNAEAAKSVTVKLDKTPPTIAATQNPSPNADGWNNTNVTVHFACADALSGLAAGSPPTDSILASDGVGQSVPGTCTDTAGNSASAAVSNIKIDKTPPSILMTTPANGAVYALNQRVGSSYACTDNLSGVASCVGPVGNGMNLDTGSTGAKTFTVNASDVAGNTNSQTASYQVICHYVSITLSPSTVPQGGSMTVTGTLRSCANTTQTVVIKFTLAGPLRPSSCASTSSVMFTTPPITLVPNTVKTVSFPFRVPTATCPGTYSITAATLLNGTTVDTSSASLNVTGK